MGVVVISKSSPVVVKPWVRTAGDSMIISLSSYDKCCMNYPDTALFVFDDPIPEPAESIKRGLSRALVHYYPMAGRLAAGATEGDVVIRCGEEEAEGGVCFVAARASCAIMDVLEYWDPSLKEELVVPYPWADGLCRYSDPLLLMQVTVFSCGGFVLGVTANHAVADGVGMGQFLEAVGELSRGAPSPSVVPLRRHQDSFLLGPPPVFTKFVEFLVSLRPSRMAVLDIIVKSSLINRIRDEYAANNNKSRRRRCTVFEAVAAVLWRCRTRAAMTVSDALTGLVVVANGRKYAGAKEGYYGNCLLAPLVLATTGAVANGDVMDLVKMIQQGTKDRPVPEQSDLDKLLQMPDPYNIMLINSWGNAFRRREAGIHFGGGRPPARVMGHSLGMVQLPKCAAGFPSNDGSYNMLAVCVKEGHAHAFLKELADMHHTYHYAPTTSRL